MFSFFKRDHKPQPVARIPLAAPIPWKNGTTLPIPDWDSIPTDEGATDEALHGVWSAVAHAWLVELATSLGPGYAIAESEEFMLLGALSDRQQRLVLDYAESTRNRVLKVLPDIAQDDGYGKTVILVFDSEVLRVHRKLLPGRNGREGVRLFVRHVHRSRVRSLRVRGRRSDADRARHRP